MPSCEFPAIRITASETFITFGAPPAGWAGAVVSLIKICVCSFLKQCLPGEKLTDSKSVRSTVANKTYLLDASKSSSNQLSYLVVKQILERISQRFTQRKTSSIISAYENTPAPPEKLLRLWTQTCISRISAILKGFCNNAQDCSPSEVCPPKCF